MKKLSAASFQPQEGEVWIELGGWRVSWIENICLYLPLLFPSSKPPCCDLQENWTESSEYFSRELPLLGGEDLWALHLVSSVAER